MVKFGDLTEQEKQAFGELVKKNSEKPEKEPPFQIWVDDEELLKRYFDNNR